MGVREPWQGRYRQGPTASTLSQTSGASPYRRGRDFERAVRGRLERRGYFVMRAHGSKGKVDLLAVSHATAAAGISGLMIQCKRTGSIGSQEWNEVYDIAEAAGGWPVVCFRPSLRDVAFMRLDERREHGRQGRPWTAIDVEACAEIAQPPTLPLAV